MALPIIRYTAGIVHWPINVLEELDRQTRKLLTIHRGLHPRSDVDRLYLPRQKGGRCLCSVLDVVREEERSILHYVNQSNDPLISEVRAAQLLHESPTVEQYINYG